MSRVLPLGSVFKMDIKSEQKYMIVSRIVKNPDDGKYYDYCACELPVGVCTNRPVIYANLEDIKQLMFIGYQDEMELAISVKLAEDRDELIAMAEKMENNAKRD